MFLQEELAAAYAALEVADKRAAELQSELEQAAASHPEVATGLLAPCPSLSSVHYPPCTVVHIQGLDTAAVASRAEPQALFDSLPRHAHEHKVLLLHAVLQA